MLLRRTLSLPPAAQRRLAGKPFRRDGLELSATAQLMLRMQKIAREPGPETLPLEEGRLAIRQQAIMVGGEQPIGQVHERTVRGADGPLPARLYVPRGVSAPGPLLMYFHGGAMVYGDLESHDALCRFLAEQAGVRVLAVDYRLAPEHPYPAGAQDAAAAYEWVASNAADYDADPERLAVGGDSAGAYLAAVAAMQAAKDGTPLAFQLLIYPVTDWTGSFPSRRRFAEGLYLTREFMALGNELYLGDHDPADPEASILFADVPEGLAPALITTAGFDPLRDEGEEYAEKLAKAGVQVTHRRFPGEIHGFANLLAVESSARRAMVETARELRQALAR